MSKNEKTELWIFGGVTVALLLWLWWRGKVSATNNASMQTVPPTSGFTYNYDPMLTTYAANPAAFGPQTVNGSVDIIVSGYNGINQNYMPLFGFVGMAQGELWGGMGGTLGTAAANTNSI